MSNPFLAEIRIFPFNFAPTGWALCDGQLMAISQNTALFALLGTTYGGDGKSTFALPNLQGCSAMHWGQGPGLTLRDLGETAGEQFVALLDSEQPSHTHALQASPLPADLDTPSSVNALARSSPGIYKTPPGTPTVPMSFGTVGVAGFGQPHNNMMPYLTLNFCIALQGIFPARS